MAKNSEKVVSDLTKELLDKIGVKAEVSVKDDKDNIKVLVSGDNLGALIGYHGETLESLQLVLGLIVNNQLASDEWKRVVLDIGNWRTERLNTLEAMVAQAVGELRNNDLQRVNLPPMSPSQRREVHVIVTDKYPELATESEGEEPHRRVVLYIK